MSSSHRSKKLTTKLGTTVYFVEDAKKISFQNSIVIYDEYLINIPVIQKLLQMAEIKIAVPQGEKCKSLEVYQKVIQQIAALNQRIGTKDLHIVGIGGGSCGDLTGFVASTFHRGVKLSYIPTTWLSAVDSAHGGKNALNLENLKNQIGSFYQPESVWLVREILFSQPSQRVEDAYGEVLKTALLAGGSLWTQISKIRSLDSKTLWSLLPGLVETKYKIVTRDPQEKKGIRSLLNLGHTLGHVFESRLGLTHGVAVLHGVAAALYFSEQKKICPSHVIKKITNDLQERLPSRETIHQMLSQVKDLEKTLLADKKRDSGDQVRFIFIKKPGEMKISKVSVSDLVAFKP